MKNVLKFCLKSLYIKIFIVSITLFGGMQAVGELSGQEGQLGKGDNAKQERVKTRQDIAKERQERLRRRGPGKVALQNEVAKQAERDNIDTRSFQEVIVATTPDRFTQTEAHLHLSSVRKLVNDSYRVEPYLDVVSTVIANEARFRASHYAFYNTTSNMWRLAQDLYTRLYARFNPGQEKSHFTFLRFNDESVNSTAQGFLVNELREKGLVDDNSETGAILLSVNLSLFGNVGFPGECSWQYFVLPQGHKAPRRETFENMMKKFGLTDKYIDELMALIPIYDTKEDTIVQVLVPKEKIDQIGYLAWVKGIPAHQGTINAILAASRSKAFYKVKTTMEKLTERFAAEKENNPLYKDMMAAVLAGDFSLDSFLKVYCNKPWDIKEINDVTARLLFTPDVLLNPDSGVKFYRFSTVHSDKLKEYSTKLNAIIDRLIAEKDAQDDAETVSGQ